MALDKVEVPKDTVFYAGDKIRFAVQCNTPGYLYIISRGSSGTWKPIFPSKEIADGDNHVEGFRPYKMPPKSRMVFDEQTGAEKLFIVFWHEPEPEFENLIYSLPGSKATPEPSKPASTPESPVKKPKDHERQPVAPDLQPCDKEEWRATSSIPAGRCVCFYIGTRLAGFEHLRQPFEFLDVGRHPGASDRQSVRRIEPEHSSGAASRVRRKRSEV